MAGIIGRAFLLVLLLLLPGFFASTVAYADSDTAPEGMLGVRLLDVPTARTDDPRARTYIVDHLAPGTTIRRRIEISNTTRAPAAVAVYEAAASINDGVFTPSAGRDRNDLTHWTSVDETSLELPSNQARAVTVTINLPPDAAAGEHYGVVWAEMQSTSPGTVTVVNRVGIRVYLSVGAGGEPPSAMHVDSLTAGRSQDGRPTVTAQVSNTGGRALDIAGRLTLTAGPGGLSGGPYDTAKALTLRPRQNGTIEFVLSAGLPDGPWTAHLDATSGTTTASQDNTITFPLLPNTLEPSPDFTPWLPYALVTSVLILVGILALTRATARKNTKA